MLDHYKEILENYEKIKSLLPSITKGQYIYIKENFMELDCDLRVFISYSHENKEIAGMIKEAFTMLAIDSFLAHEDIPGGEEWEKEIKGELEKCNIFVPILTNEFKESEWTCQETGAAWIRNATIIPLSLIIDGKEAVMPSGFIKKIQGLKINLSKDKNFEIEERKNMINQLVQRISKTLANKQEINERFKGCFVNSLFKSQSFAESNLKSTAISSLKPFSVPQIKMIVFSYVLNSQIYGASLMDKEIKSLLNENQDKMDETLKSIFKLISNSSTPAGNDIS